MPEFPNLFATVYMLVKGKGMSPEAIKLRRHLQYRLEIVPITHSRRQKTLSITGSPPVVLMSSSNWTYAPPDWIERAAEQGFKEFMACVPYAPLICVSRGKLLCMAAGPFALVICLALETNVFGMPTSLYREITAESIPGPNAQRGDELRVFKVPARLVDPNSPQDVARTIKIVAAFVSPEWTWVINDFTSLVRMHLYCLPNGIWTENMLRPGAEGWNMVFSAFQGGPDWILETVEAASNLDLWRQDVIEHATRQRRTGCQRRIEFYFSDTAADEMEEERDFRPIISEIAKNKFNSFAGIGRYTANDFLYAMCIYPGTPSSVICMSDERYAAFRDGLYSYIRQFTQQSFLDRASSIANTMNPLSFNEWANSVYLSKWVYVYRRSKAKVPVDLYNRYMTMGLLDENHTIGEPYVPNPGDLLDEHVRKWRYVPVYRCGGDNGKKAFYTIIKAKTPNAWGRDVNRVRYLDDIKEFSYRTTLGTAQFHVQLLNRPFYHKTEPGLLAIGRPQKMHTGKRGRPCKGISKKKISKLYDVQVGRRSI